jgi:hypothetical protein
MECATWLSGARAIILAWAERLRITPTLAHHHQLVADLASVMVAVWRELGLPLGGTAEDIPRRAETMAAGG